MTHVLEIALSEKNEQCFQRLTREVRLGHHLTTPAWGVYSICLVRGDHVEDATASACMMHASPRMLLVCTTSTKGQ